jgi:uncharacterized protein HemX
MTMTNERQFANKIRHVLNQGTRLDAATLERLRAARERALSMQRQPRAQLVPAFAGPGGGELGGWGPFALQVLLPVALVLASAVALFGWQQAQQQAEVEAIDAALLTDDLPIDALLDHGFEAWLKKRGAR